MATGKSSLMQWGYLLAGFFVLLSAARDLWGYLTLLNAPVGGTPQSYLFVTDALNQLPKLQQVIAKLKNLYGFSDQEIEDFKKNWVKEQGR